MEDGRWTSRRSTDSRWRRARQPRRAQTRKARNHGLEDPPTSRKSSTRARPQIHRPADARESPLFPLRLILTKLRSSWPRCRPGRGNMDSFVGADFRRMSAQSFTIVGVPTSSRANATSGLRSSPRASDGGRTCCGPLSQRSNQRRAIRLSKVRNFGRDADLIPANSKGDLIL